MLLYNVTYLVPTELVSEWLRWMKEEHLPEIMATTLFEKNIFLQLLNVEEQDGETYALQLYTLSDSEFEEYEKKFEPALRMEIKQKWGEQIMSFSTLMRIVQ